MLKDILPQYIIKAIENFDIEGLQEIRLRVNLPIVIQYFSHKKILKNGIGNLVASKKDLENIVLKGANYSIYSVENQLKEGYLSLKNGVRIGIGGEFSHDNYNIKNIQSLNIRIPHQIKNCSKIIFPKLFTGNSFQNTIIVSVAGAGKTTLIRDILYQFSEQEKIYNISVVDERNEISALVDGIPTLDIGCCDVISHIKKDRGIIYSIKNLNPDIIVTDEITTDEDMLAVKRGLNMGVKFLTSIHCDSFENLILKENLKDIIKNHCFKRYVMLNKDEEVGTIEGVYNENFIKI